MTRLKSLYAAERSLVELTAAGLGEDARIAVPQHDDRTLDESFGTRVPPLVQLETVLQGLVGHLLHPGIDRRVNLDTSLREDFPREVRAEAFEFLKDSSKDRRRLKHLVFAPRGRLESGAARPLSPQPGK